MPKKPLRIAWITNNYTPYTSGVAQSLTASLGALQALGHEVRIITLDFLGSRHNDPNWVIRVPCLARFMRHGNHMAVPWRSDAHVKRILQDFDPDIVHSHHPFLLGVSALKAARALHKPIIFTHHTLYQAYAHHIPLPQSLVRRAIGLRVARYCQSVDRVIVPSKPVAYMLEAYALKYMPIVVSSGIRAAFLTDVPSYQKKERFNLLVVSRFAPEKNLVFILDAYAQLKKKNLFTLIFAGYGPQINALRSYAYDVLNLTYQQVFFIDRPQENTLANLYRQADLFLFSSHTDTQGIVLAEAMAHGVPVIACDGPGQREIVRNGQNGFLTDCPQQMARLIERCFADDQVYCQLRQQALLTGRQYDPAILVHKLLSVYETVLP